MKLTNKTPREDGFYMPGEFEPHQGCILIWPKRPGSWGYEAKAAGNAFAAVIKAIAQSEKVYVAVTKETLPIAQEKLFGENKNADIMQQDNIELFFADTDDAWRSIVPVKAKLICKCTGKCIILFPRSIQTINISAPRIKFPIYGSNNRITSRTLI